MLRGTPFHSRTSVLCEAQNWRRWSGYIVAGSYELTHEREYWAIRSSAALFDVSPLFKYDITGPDAGRLLDRVLTREVTKCKVGQVMYTPWCDEDGKVIDDGTVWRLDDRVFRLTSADPNIRWLHQNGFGLDVRIEDVSDAIATLSLQGPLSREILKQVVGVDLDGLKYFRLTSGTLRNIPVTITRTGYTGDRGYEVWVDAHRAEALWDSLIEAGKPYQITPAGMLALDLARIEAGLLLIEVDYVSAHKAVVESRKSSPYELGLGWTVSPDKAPFVGQKALRAEKGRGSAWQFVGIEVDWEPLEQLHAAEGLPPQLPTVAWRTSIPIYSNGRQVGYATSGCWSPLLKKYIALAHLESAYANPGTRLMMEVTVEHKRKQAAARVVRIPFFEPERKRA
ncbi:MAG TPA: aminomethyltransferase family protein [Anaerolineae bacterium]|nr:aminomethyltransferase family protein [Anaerolineae bacterium]